MSDRPWPAADKAAEAIVQPFVDRARALLAQHETPAMKEAAQLALVAYYNCAGSQEWRLREALRVGCASFQTRIAELEDELEDLRLEMRDAAARSEE